MTTVLVRHRITDLPAWLSLLDDLAAARRAHGCTGARRYRQADDPDAVALELDFPTSGQAHAFLADPALRAAMTRPGVPGPHELVLLEPALPPASARKAVLLVGLDPKVVDYSKFPGLDEPKLVAGLAVSLDATTAAGFAAEWCLITAEWQQAEPVLRARLAARDYAAVMIGAGIRTDPTQLLLFERILDLIHAVAPGARLCFSTSPTSAAEAVLRWVRP